jgi:hypothetical protein
MKNYMTSFEIIEDTRDIIEDSTVYTEELFNNGRSYVTRYYGTQQDLVEKYAKGVFDRIDMMRSPSMSDAQPFRDGFAVTIKFYGLD